jgi:hypothetical protein
MYVRSHIDTVSGDRKYIYIDENNKKYIRDKNKYYPVKKYKGSYILQKIRGGASINVILHVYDIKKADGTIDTDGTDETEIVTTIDLSNIVLNPSDETYKSIILDNKIYIFNKDSKLIKLVLEKNYSSGIININHFIIIKKASNKFKVYFKKYTTQDKFMIELYMSFYNIIYKRNNKIDKDSEATGEDTFFVIFSIIDDYDYDVKVNISNYEVIPDIYNQEYNSLYNTTLDKLKKIYQ